MSSTSVVRDQAFPDRPVRIIDPFGGWPAGASMSSPGLWPSRLAAAWGQPAIVENHPRRQRRHSAPLVTTRPRRVHAADQHSAQAYSAARAGELPYDPLRDFVPPRSPAGLRTGSPAAGAGITTIGAPPRPVAGPARSASPPPAPAPAPTSRWQSSIATSASPPCTPLAPAAGRTAAHASWRRRLRFPDLVRDLGASANAGRHRQHARPRHHGHPRHARNIGMADPA